MLEKLGADDTLEGLVSKGQLRRIGQHVDATALGPVHTEPPGEQIAVRAVLAAQVEGEELSIALIELTHESVQVIARRGHTRHRRSSRPLRLPLE